MRIVDTDNFAGDYSDEKFLPLPGMTTEHAEAVAKAINDGFPENFPRYYKVVEDDYVLVPGVEP